MAKYHFSTKTGKAERCTASKRPCEYANTPHFTDTSFTGISLQRGQDNKKAKAKFVDQMRQAEANRINVEAIETEHALVTQDVKALLQNVGTARTLTEPTPFDAEAKKFFTERGQDQIAYKPNASQHKEDMKMYVDNIASVENSSGSGFDKYYKENYKNSDISVEEVRMQLRDKLKNLKISMAKNITGYHANRIYNSLARLDINDSGVVDGNTVDPEHKKALEEYGKLRDIQRAWSGAPPTEDTMRKVLESQATKLHNNSEWSRQKMAKALQTSDFTDIEKIAKQQATDRINRVCFNFFAEDAKKHFNAWA